MGGFGEWVKVGLDAVALAVWVWLLCVIGFAFG